ncbi:MAG: hypothetical protein AB3N33_06970 [Puniceicoccaceae bacterium]
MTFRSKKTVTAQGIPHWRKMGLLLGCILGFATGSINAQPLDNALFSVGTSAVDEQNNNWAYILFQLTSDSENLLNRRLAVYTKPGDIQDPGQFTKTGIVALQEDPVVIKVLLARAEGIGQTPGDLNFAIDELFGELMPAEELTVEEKLSAVIRGSLFDERHFANLMLLARMHPGVSLCLGLAHAQKIGPGKTTFEIRELGPGNVEMGVVGRVAVEAGQPVVLPAPGGPVAVPDLSPKGHLNARLRWAIPNNLRRLALLQYGFNVYRVTLAMAEDLGWDLQPPEGDLLAQMSLDVPEIKLVNRSPVLPTAIFDEVDVLDLNTYPDTAFVADDNDMFDENSIPFKDGERFYYYVAARDILGRNGEVSEGTEVMMSDRVPPNAPRRPEVSNVVDYVNGQETHHLQVTWRQLASTPEEPISGYYVYRWSNPGDVQKFGADPQWNQISNFIPQDENVRRLSYIDDGQGSPTVPEDYDQTYWYTIRAVKPTAMGGNYSPNSAPAFGVLRDRNAPDPPEGQILIYCCLPIAIPDKFEDVAEDAGKDPLRVIFDLICERDNLTVAWAEFAVNDTRNPDNFLGRYDFTRYRTTVRHRLDLGRQNTEKLDLLNFYCRVGDAAGNVSEWVLFERIGLPDRGFIRQVRFLGREDCNEVVLSATSSVIGCDVHSPGGKPFPGNAPVPEDGQNPVNPIKVKFSLTEGAGEYRVYRRVDTGNLTLWRQGLADEAEAQEIVLEDGALPPNSAEITYFGQFLDDNGNASELKLLGQYVAVKQPAPDPMLSPPEVDGTDEDPRMLLKWFCTPEGVERFEVLLVPEPGPIPNSISPDLSVNQASPQNNFQLGWDSGQGDDSNAGYGAYQTPSLEAGFGPGPDYAVSIPIIKGTTYTIQIRAIAKYGGTFSYSNAYQFMWPTDSIEEATGPMVPWPARTAPEVAQKISNDMVALRVQEPDFNGMGVVIGEVPPADLIEGALIGTNADIRDYLFPVNEPSGKLLPMMLYRYQVPNEDYPTPSGDIIQVSPLMTDIATGIDKGNTLVRDPFVKIINRGTGQLDQPWPIVLLDTQPAIRKATYAYIVVRFDENGEIASVHPVPEILVP